MREELSQRLGLSEARVQVSDAPAGLYHGLQAYRAPSVEGASVLNKGVMTKQTNSQITEQHDRTFYVTIGELHISAPTDHLQDFVQKFLKYR